LHVGEVLPLEEDQGPAGQARQLRDTKGCHHHYQKVRLTADGPKTWIFVRLSTEGEPMTVPMGDQ